MLMPVSNVAAASVLDIDSAAGNICAWPEPAVPDVTVSSSAARCGSGNFCNASPHRFRSLVVEAGVGRGLASVVAGGAGVIVVVAADDSALEGGLGKVDRERRRWNCSISSFSQRLRGGIVVRI
jgi:hypothetical protein